MFNKAIVDSFVYDVDGNLDVDLTKDNYMLTMRNSNNIRLVNYAARLSAENALLMSRFEKDINDYCIIWDRWANLILESIRAVFARYPHVNKINKISLVSMASNWMLETSKIKMSEMNKAKEMIDQFLTDNSKPGGILNLIQGANGGINRI